MNAIKALHVLCVFVWVGNLLVLSRMLGYLASQDESMQMKLAKTYQRMYKFVELPTMLVAISLGIVILIGLQPKSLLWLYLKLFFVAGLVVCDIFCGLFIGQLLQGPITGRGVKYKILHGVAGLMLVGILFSIYVGKPGLS